MGVGEGAHVLIDCSIRPIVGPSKVVYIIQMKSMALREACAAPVDGQGTSAFDPRSFGAY